MSQTRPRLKHTDFTAQSRPTIQDDHSPDYTKFPNFATPLIAINNQRHYIIYA